VQRGVGGFHDFVFMPPVPERQLPAFYAQKVSFTAFVFTPMTLSEPCCYAMIQSRPHFPRCIAALVIALALATSGCGESASRLADSARKAGTAEQWHAWAAQVIERSRTNSSLPAEPEWPDFVRRIGAGRQLLVETNGLPLVMLVSFGGFQSIGLVIGPISYVETNAPGVPLTSKQVYPGMYVRESH
jgi:hypothetical protein